MSTYTKEPGYIYIETEADRLKYGPKKEGDDVCFDGRWVPLQGVGPGYGFWSEFTYRRPIPATATDSPWLPVAPATTLPPGVTDGTHWVEVAYVSGNTCVYWPSVFQHACFAGTHYRLIPKIAPPAVASNSQEGTAASDAYYAWQGSDDGTDEPQDAFLAGVKWEKDRAALAGDLGDE